MLWHKAIGAGGVGGSNVKAFAYVSSNSIDRASSSAAFTFSSQSIGAEDANRVLVIGVGGFRAFAAIGTNPTVTVGGVSATRVIDRNPDNNGGVSLTLFAIEYPTGTSADIVVSHGEATTCGIGVYRMVYVGDGVTPSTTASVAYSSTSPTTVSLNINSNNPSSSIVGFSYSANGINPAWTGVTKDFGFDTRSAEWFSGASLYPSEITGTLSVTRSEGGGLTSATVLASWD